MKISPIPLRLLDSSVTLLLPSQDGYSSVEVERVRVVRSSKVREYSAAVQRDVSQLTVYYDCVNSLPASLSFPAGALILYDGVRYEITESQLFSAVSPHHIRITAVKV